MSKAIEKVMPGKPSRTKLPFPHYGKEGLSKWQTQKSTTARLFEGGLFLSHLAAREPIMELS
jgi:hypothetical protein